MTTLATSRLLLRQFTLDDAPAVMNLINDPEVTGNLLDMQPPFTLTAIESMIERSHQTHAAQTAFVFAIQRQSSAVLLGSCGLRVGPVAGCGSINYWIGKQYWWQGYATEAAKALLQFGFDALGLLRIEARVREHNMPAVRVLTKIGLQLADVQPADGIEAPVAVYGMDSPASIAAD